MAKGGLSPQHKAEGANMYQTRGLGRLREMQMGLLARQARGLAEDGHGKPELTARISLGLERHVSMGGMAIAYALKGFPRSRSG